MMIRSLATGLLAFSALTLSACQTLPQVIATGPQTFDVRYAQGTPVADVDARAAAVCSDTPALVGSGQRFDGFQFRSYHCHRKP